MIAAAGARVASVDHEFFRAEARLARGFVQEIRAFAELIPARRRMNIHFDHAGIRRDAKACQARIRGGS